MKSVNHHQLLNVLHKKILGLPLSSEERLVFDGWINLSEENANLWDELSTENILIGRIETFTSIDHEAGRIKLTDFLKTKRLEKTLPVSVKSVHRVHFLRTTWFRYAAAIIVLFGIGAYLWNSQINSDTITQSQPVPVEYEAVPGSNKATLTFADGKQITLDSSASALLAEKGISNDNALIIYRNKVEKSEFNTLTTPKGGQYKIKLGDGTIVWLNAASSITYPTVFINKNREVNITGEVYFEVAKNKEKPFIIHTGKETITVLGTSFNVNAYPDEQSSKTSLLEGSIKVGNAVLRPGQAYLNGKVIQTNIDQDIAWKNGAFNFSDADLPTVLRQLARWYDLEVRYEGKGTNQKLIGQLSRNLPLSEVINVLQDFNVKFRMEGKTLVVQ